MKFRWMAVALVFFAAVAVRAAHAHFVALQTPERLHDGTLWTGRWQRDEAFWEWEREAAAPV